MAFYLLQLCWKLSVSIILKDNLIFTFLDAFLKIIVSNLKKGLLCANSSHEPVVPKKV